MSVDALRANNHILYAFPFQVNFGSTSRHQQKLKKCGIYPYILTRDEKYLSIRAFTDAMKQKVYEKQKGKCVKCKRSLN